jgi:hypothetical protein
LGEELGCSCWKPGSISNVEQEIERLTRINDSHVSDFDTMLLISRIKNWFRNPLWAAIAMGTEEGRVQIGVGIPWYVIEMVLAMTQTAVTWNANMRC